MEQKERTNWKVADQWLETCPSLASQQQACRMEQTLKQGCCESRWAITSFVISGHRRTNQIQRAS